MTQSIDQQDLSALIGDIYDCALDASRWVPTLRRLSTVMGSRAGTIVTHGEGRASFSYDWGTPPEFLDIYVQQFIRINPLLTLGWHSGVDDPMSLERFMTYDELRRTEFYRDFLRPLGWLDFLVIVLEKTATSFSTISFSRYESAGAPTEGQRSLLKLLAPHLRRAAIFHGVKERDAARADDIAAALDLMQVPLLLLDATGKCIEANASAEKFLTETDAITLRQGMVQARDVTLPTTVDPAGPGPMSFALTQADGRKFAGHLIPLDRDGTAGRATAALFIQPVGELQPLPGEVLVKLYGLTPAETRLIALLGQDYSLEDAAATLGIAITTARTHLQRIFQKTNTSRQSQVVKLVLSALPRPPG